MEKIYVKWLNSVVVGEVSWLFKEDFGELLPSVCETVGFLLSDKENHITVAQSISEEQLLGIVTIAKSVILEQVELSAHRASKKVGEDVKEN